MKYKINEVQHEYNGKVMTDLQLTFENGKKWLLVPLCKDDSKKAKSYFYALLNNTARK